MEINQIIAHNVKFYRLKAGLNISQLAEAAGISKSMLSQIEGGTTNPTINTIWKICAGLNIPYTLLLEDSDLNKPTIIQKNKILQQHSADGHYRIFNYFPQSIHRRFELFQMELDPHSQYKSVGHSSNSEEYVMVIAGTLWITVNNQKNLLKKDDTIFFNPTNPHIYSNETNVIAKAVIINNYY